MNRISALIDSSSDDDEADAHSTRKSKAGANSQDAKIKGGKRSAATAPPGSRLASIEEDPDEAAEAAPMDVEGADDADEAAEAAAEQGGDAGSSDGSDEPNGFTRVYCSSLAVIHSFHSAVFGSAPLSLSSCGRVGASGRAPRPDSAGR